MNSYMHFMHPPKIVQIGWGHHVNFCVWKKSAITFGEGCTEHKYMTIENRISIYNAFLSANYTYCNTVWHFCSNRSLYMLEKVNKKALRVVLNDYVSTYRELLDKVSEPTLYVARLKAIAIEAYKCYVNENPQYINVMFDSVDKPYNLMEYFYISGMEFSTLPL